MRDWVNDVVIFQECVPAGYVSKTPTTDIPEDVERLRLSLVAEEIGELSEAVANKDIIGIADGVGDSIYVLIGLAVAYGIDLRPVWAEIHHSNMAKMGGPVAEDGKQLKPEGWEPPDIARALEDGHL